MEKIWFKLLSVRLKTKLLVGFILIITAIITTFAIIAVNFLSIEAKYNEVNLINNDAQLFTQLKADINGIRTAFLRIALKNDPDVWENQEGVIEFFAEKINENISTLKKGRHEKYIVEIENAWRPFSATISEELIPLVKAGRVDAAIVILETKQAERSRVFMQIANEMITSSREEFISHMATIDQKIKATAIATVTITVVMLSIIFVVIFVFANKYVIAILEQITASAAKVAQGDLSANISYEVKDEFGTLADSYNRVVQSFQEVASVCEAISHNDLSKSLKVKSEKDILSISVNKMTADLKEAREKNRNQDWLKTGLNELNNKARGEQDILVLARNITGFICEYLGAQFGALYLFDGKDTFKLAGSYAYMKTDAISAASYKLGEGLAGQAAIDKKITLINNVPDNYIKIESGLGRAAPRNIVIAPLLCKEAVEGVLEIGSFNEITGLQMDFLAQVVEDIAITINVEQSHVMVKELLGKTLEQTEELRSSQEELGQINEELEQQSSVLQKQRDELQEKNNKIEVASRMLEQKARELELSSAYKSQFLANMSHELRTPLNSMIVLSQVMGKNESGNLTDKQVEYAKTINNAGADLQLLINDILDLSKIEAGKMEIHPDRVSIDDLLDNTGANFEHLAQKKGLYLKMEKSTDTPDYIITDRQRLEQIIRNFLSNAFKFTSKGGITVSVYRPSTDDISLSQNGLSSANAVAITVADTGVGIHKDKQELIFEAFQQADGTTSRQYGGTGLGLTISKDLAKLLGGAISLQSNEGKGSAFTLCLPESLKEASVTKTEGVTSRYEKPHPDFHVEKKTSDPEITTDDIRDDRENVLPGDKTVLIIEDDPQFAKILYDLAAEKGFKRLIAGDGEAGLYLADYYTPQAIIIDIGLPRMDGQTVMEKIKVNPRTSCIPVHVISTSDKQTIAMAMGAIGYLQKPVSAEHLNRVIDRIGSADSKAITNLLILDGDADLRGSLAELIGKRVDVKVTVVGTANEALKLLSSEVFDGLILDMDDLPDRSGTELMDDIRKDKVFGKIPTIIHTGRELTVEENEKLQHIADSVIIRGSKFSERLIDETTLFLHRVEAELPSKKQEAMKSTYDKDAALKGRKILVTDDDMRNMFALTSVLEEKGMKTLMAKNGKEALQSLDKNPDADIVLMDIMMPEMDGYEAIQEIRKQGRFKKLPIIVITAKVMRGDRDKCIEAGASDYLAKPIEIDKLFSLLRVWLYNQPAMTTSK